MPMKKVVKKNKKMPKKNIKKKIIKKLTKKNIKKKTFHKNLIKNVNNNSVVFNFPLLKEKFKKDSFVLPPSSKIDGDISYHTVILQGLFNGTIRAGEIFILAGAKITGEIFCNKIIIHGTCHANINCKNLCLVKSRAVVKGDINYDGNLSIEVGGKVFGGLVPKRKPLALPNYSGQKSDDSDQIQPQNLFNESLINNSNATRSVKDKSLDSLISKIFK